MKGRRNFLKLAAMTSVFPFLEGGCSSETNSSLPRMRTVSRTLHVDMTHLKHWPAEALDKVVVEIAGVRRPVTPHTEETRQRLFSPHSRATHYVEAVAFSALGPQSYVVGIPNANGQITPLLAGIHLPETNRRSAAAAAPPSDTEEDVYVLADPESCALWAVYHNTKILTLDKDTAKVVVEHIRQTDSFTKLIRAVETAGPAVTPEAAELHHYAGWMTGEYVLNGRGEKIEQTDLEGRPIVRDGKPVYRTRFVADKAVAAATTEVVAESVRRFHDDASLEGVKYLTLQGVAVAGRRDGVLGALKDEEKKFDFVFHDEGKERGRRSLKIERTGPKSFVLDVRNPNSVGTGLGVTGYDTSGKEIWHQLIGYVSGTYYPSLTVFAGPSTGAFSVTLPADTAKFEIVSAAVGVSPGDFDVSDHLDEALATLFLSGILDFFLPCALLGLGVGGEIAHGLTLELFKELARDAFKEVVIEAVKIALVDTFNAAAGHLDGSVILENLAEIALGIANAIGHFVANGMVAGVVAILAEIVTEAAIESAAEAAAPVVGWVLKGIEIAETVAQLAVQAVDIATGQFTVKWPVEPAHPVTVVLRPEESQSAYFPQSAVSYELTLTPRGRLPIQIRDAFQPAQSTFSIEIPEPVPLLGTLKADVVLRNDAGEAVGRASVTVENATEIGEEQEIELEVEGIPTPIRKGTRLSHTRKLEVSPTTRRFVTTAQAPTADDRALSCTSEGVCRALGISVSQIRGVLGYAFETRMLCANALATQLHVVSVLEGGPSHALACGTSAVSQVALSVGEGPSSVIAKTAEGRYGVFLVEPGKELPSTFAASSAAGLLRGETLIRARMHAAGYVLALTDVGVEVVDLSKHEALKRPADPDLFFRMGTRLGQMSGPVSVAPLRGRHGYALLEQGTRRLQALDFSGNYLKAWGSQPFIQLRKDAGRIYLDVDVDGGGNMWVLSYRHGASAGGAFVVDVFDPLGRRVVSFDDVNAMALTLDAFNTLYTENAENAIGPGGYPEPTVSIWTPENA